MHKLVIVKLGGSVITDKSKPFTARREVIGRLAKELKVALSEFKGKAIIVHGGGSFPHIPAAKYQTQLGLIGKDSLKGLSLTCDAAIAINRIVVGEFLKQNLPVVSFSAGSSIFSKGKTYKSFFLPIKKALDVGVIPMLYGDVVFNEYQGWVIFSGEKIIGALVDSLHSEYKITRVIYCSDTNGVYDKDGKTISKITPGTLAKVKTSLGASGKVDVTGGMIHKVQEALGMARKYKVKTAIVNGLKKKALEKAILAQKVVGTEISF